MDAIHIDDDHKFIFHDSGITHPVYRDGSGPGVLILHELPGMSPKCIELAQLVMHQGYTVYLPLLFGSPRQFSMGKGLLSLAKLCIAKEFTCLSTNKPSRISNWLRALCRRIKAECGGKGAGAIGMCMTGNVIISLMLDDSVMAPVMSQPSFPICQISFPGLASKETRKRALGVPDEDVKLAAEKAKTVPLLAYRFATDQHVPAERFASLREAFGTCLRAREIPTGPDNPGNIPNGAHCVLTESFVNAPGHPTRQALDEILEYFAQQL
jgi:dienelactone hydrolase